MQATMPSTAAVQAVVGTSCPRASARTGSRRARTTGKRRRMPEAWHAAAYRTLNGEGAPAAPDRSPPFDVPGGTPPCLFQDDRLAPALPVAHLERDLLALLHVL